MKKSTRIRKNVEDDEFVKLVMEVKESMYRIASCRLNNYEDVLDVIQNTILSAYKNISQLENKKYFKTWIIKILINECNLFYKKQYKDEKIVNDIKAFNHSYSNYDEQFTNSINSSLDFKRLMKTLSETEQIVVSLFYSDDFSCNDISEVLDMNVNTVKTHLKRAKDKLKIYYGKRGDYSEK